MDRQNEGIEGKDPDRHERFAAMRLRGKIPQKINCNDALFAVLIISKFACNVMI